MRRSSAVRADDPWVGRSEDVAALERLFASDTRIVTVTGAGGIGKTRLATRYASSPAAAALFGERVAFCDLQDARTAFHVARVLADVLRINTTSVATILDDVGDELAKRPPMLLVLDNFEQLVATATETIGAWHRAAPNVRFLVTSREPLEIAGESRHELAPLEPSDAAALFIAHAARVVPGFELDELDQEHLHTITSRLDGNPLALEIVAARVAVLSLADIASRIDDVLDIPRAARDAPERHRSLRAAIAWSYDLLDPADRTSLMELSVFRGGFDVKAAEVVLSIKSAPAEQCVSRLVRHSFAVSRRVDGAVRFEMPEAVRAFARERLAEASADGLRQIEERTSAWMLQLATRMRSDVDSGNAPRGIASFLAEKENIIGVHSFLVEQGRDAEALRLLAMLAPLFCGYSSSAFYRAALERGLERGGPGLDARVRGQALVALARIVRVSTSSPDALGIAQEGISIGEKLGDCEIVADGLLQLAGFGYQTQDFEYGAEHAARAIEVARDGNLPVLEVLGRAIQGLIAVSDRRTVDGTRDLEQMRALMVRPGKWINAPQMHLLAANLAGARGADEEMLDELARSIAAAAELRHRPLTLTAQTALATAHLEIGNVDEAEKILRETRNGFRDAGMWTFVESEWMLGNIAAQRKDLRGAREAFTNVVAATESRSLPYLRSLALASQAVVLAMRGDVASARAEIERVDVQKGDAFLEVVTLEILGSLVDLVEGRAAFLARRSAEGAQLTERGRTKLRAALARISRPLLNAPLTAAARSWALSTCAQFGVSLEDSSQVALTVGPRAEWFSIGDAPPTSLQGKRVVRRAFEALVIQHRASPGNAISTDDLISAVWTETSEIDRAVLNKLYAIIRLLRGVGLGELVESHDGGYRLKADLELRQVD